MCHITQGCIFYRQANCFCGFICKNQVADLGLKLLVFMRNKHFRAILQQLFANVLTSNLTMSVFLVFINTNVMLYIFP